jgi:uncharacterized Tic20 family protein
MIKAAMLAYLFGLLAFYVLARFGVDVWDWGYYIWDKAAGGSVLVWWALMKSNNRYRKQIKMVLMFSMLRFVWEVVSFFTGLSVNNVVAVSVLFIVIVTVISYLCLHENGRLSKFLSKYL